MQKKTNERFFKKYFKKGYGCGKKQAYHETKLLQINEYSALHCCLGNRIRGKLLQVLSSCWMQSSKLGCRWYLAADCLPASQSLSLPTQLLAQSWIHPSSKLSSLEWWGPLQIRSTRTKALCSWPYYSKFACH